MTTQNAGLITTKLNVPLLKMRLVDRARLVDRLSAGKDRPLTVISSVAGSGKTSLACQWILRDKLPAAWYSIEESDNASDLFFQYFIAALNTLENLPYSINDFWRIGRIGISPLKTAHDLLIALADLPSDIYLFLDDYQFITAKEIHDAMVYILDHMPPKFHLVLISRYDIPFPLSRLKLRNQVTEISAADMRFSERETEQFFVDIISVPMTTQEIKELTRYSEGWVGGLQLLGLSLKGKKVSDRLKTALAGAKWEMIEYLVNEVINVQSRKVKAFLEATALLDRFNAEVAAELTGLNDTNHIINHIYRNHLFLVPLDNQRQWYRYHHLFSQAVRERVKVSAPDLPCKVHRRAAIWFAENGFLEDAFRSAFAVRDIEFAADLLEDYLLDINDRHEYASGRHWIAKLPHEVFMQRTLLRLHDCGQKVESLQLADIEAVIKDIEANPDHAFARYQGPKKRMCEDLFIYFGYVLRYYYRDPAHADVKQLEQAYQMISPENKIFSGYIMILLTLTHLAQGDPTLADAALGKASPIIISSGAYWARSFWYRLKSVVERVQGHLRRSETVLTEAFDFLAGKDLLDAPLKSALHLPMAWICYHRNELEQALEYAADAAAYGERVKFVRDMVEGNLLLALVHCAQGNKTQAMLFVKKMQRISKEWDAADLSVSADSWIVRLYMLQDEFGKSEQWSKGKHLSADAIFSMRRIQEHLNGAELLYHKGRYREARLLLEKLRRRCVAHNMMEAVLEIDLLLCGALYALKAHAQAKAVLEQALAFGEAEGYVRLFINHARIIAPVLAAIAGLTPESDRSDFIKTLVSFCGLGTASDEMSDKKPEMASRAALTPRELEVLTFMAEGWQYKEIAKKTFVSYETVKTHVKHIFEKLGANSKLEAIRKAGHLHLFDSRS